MTNLVRLDMETGKLCLENESLAIWPNMGLKDFLQAVGEDAVLSNEHGDRRTYDFKDLVAEGRGCLFSFYFKGGHLELVDFSMRLEEAKNNSSALSEQNEQIRKAIHDRWIERELGSAPYEYSWGSICSLYDERSDNSVVILRYKL